MDIASPMGRVSAWFENFRKALENVVAKALKSLVVEEFYWRDLVSFTWNTKTMESRNAIADMVLAMLGDAHPKNCKIDDRSAGCTKCITSPEGRPGETGSI
ncbi:hypothetical protein [Ruegeria arenilitoris]|uniref:hypothetical protein n=1 Tax=Ruegeria arenilitoris TaxID=1173585 RepID=UPI00147FB07B|nr:hypothetical protein [Ruegeria arenilitoris]